MYTLDVRTPSGDVVSKHYDSVVLAAPLATSGVQFEGFSQVAAAATASGGRTAGKGQCQQIGPDGVCTEDGHKTNNNGYRFSDSSSKNLISDISAAAERSYRTMHVTLVEGVYRASYFGYTTWSQVPDMLLTTPTISTNRTTSSGAPLVFSFCHLQTRLDNHTGLSLYKLFSDQAMSDADLQLVFEHPNLDAVVRHTWQGAYPNLKPIPASVAEEQAGGSNGNNADQRSGFTSRNAGNGGLNDGIRSLPGMTLGPLFYYINAFESVFSTMESELVAAKNVARLLFRDVALMQSTASASA